MFPPLSVESSPPLAHLLAQPPPTPSTCDAAVLPPAEGASVTDRLMEVVATAGGYKSNVRWWRGGERVLNGAAVRAGSTCMLHPHPQRSCQLASGWLHLGILRPRLPTAASPSSCTLQACAPSRCKLPAGAWFLKSHKKHQWNWSSAMQRGCWQAGAAQTTLAGLCSWGCATTAGGACRSWGCHGGGRCQWLGRQQPMRWDNGA